MIRNILKKDKNYNRYIVFSIFLNLLYTMRILHEYLCLNINPFKYNLLEFARTIKNLNFFSYVLIGLMLLNNIIFMGYRDKIKHLGLKIGLFLGILASQSLIDLLISYIFNISILKLAIPIYITVSSLIFLEIYIKFAKIIERKIMLDLN